MRNHVWKIALLCAAVSTAVFGFAPKRPPIPAEQKAITKYTDTMNKVLDQFQSDDWDEHIDYAIENPLVAPMRDRPFVIDQMLQRSYEAHPGSPRYQNVIMPIFTKMSAEPDMKQKQLQGAKIGDLLHLQVQVQFNMVDVSMATAPDSQHDPRVPGATFVHQDANNPLNHGVAYVLFFSNGRTGKWSAADNLYRNTFIHPPDSPYIENIEIRLYGASDRIKELLHKVDWNQVNAALTQ